MPQGFVELSMYIAPPRVCEASEAWLARIVERLEAQRERAIGLDLPQLWRSPRLLLTQTCGYPLMTQLRGQVRLIGKPRYELPHAQAGQHCSLVLARVDDPRPSLAAFFGSHGLVNSPDSNSGMNLFRHLLAPWQREGRFFREVTFTGGHRDSLRALREGRGDLAAIDSVTYDYLARDHSTEVQGLRVVAQTASSPSLPYIGAPWLSDAQAEGIRLAMNQALADLPEVAATLAIAEVLPASEAEYQVLLDYEANAARLGLPVLE
ncbi:PhnD/SsuA/transferrin family substrate-binding protein [Pseudomonas entomophila]|uniref:phosphate/phosphite/phosphonate ABC transporter substrate-binding protein n=1 Tax=Pseudomonas entomophila TaxID=312306 RepID=UPI0023D87E95|nr:PhnD/SsuA/transferrin family substrate-binding protein [Pseudomonas entomophila]MDF0732817.1 PhnD/SsuA/transferrin family substrate-binding protein [Pseudomonas entomophila]